MNKKLLFLLTSMFVSITHLFSQKPDTLLLNIAGTNKLDVSLKLNGRTIDDGAPRDLNPALNSWVFNVVIKDKVKKSIEVDVTNPDGMRSVSLDEGTHVYHISDNKITEKQFPLDIKFEIDVTNKNDNNSIRKFTLNYKVLPAGAVRETGDGNQPLIGYKIGAPVYDAYYLVNGRSEAIKIGILAYYGLNPSNKTLDTNDFQGNPFLDTLANSFLSSSNGNAQGGGLAASIFSSIGGLDVTSFADGLAKFLVKRAKQELSISFFEKFKAIIQRTPDIGTIFPRTAALLLAINDEIYDYQRYLQNLREAFKQDIAEIHRNLPGIVDNHPAFFSHHQPAKAALLTACYIVSQLEDEAHPGDILANYPVEYLDSINGNSFGRNNFKGAIQTIQLISASLKDTSSQENANYWAGIEQIRKLVNDKEVFKMYLGLLYQEAQRKYGGIQFDKTNLLDILKEIAKNYEQVFGVYISYRSYILRFGEKTTALNNMIKEQRKEDLSDSARVEKYTTYFRTAIDLIEYFTQASQLPFIKENLFFNDLNEKLKKYFKVSYAAADLVSSINRKNYSAAINSAVRVYDLVTLKTSSEDPVDTTADTANLLNEKSSGPDSLKNNVTKLARYGAFMASVATAKNSDEVEASIEAFALPTGSSRIKRVSDFNVALNAYVGFYAGFERIRGYDTGQLKLNTAGITAPVGVAASWGHHLLFWKTGKSEWSTSVFVSLIDIGTVAAFRFKNDTTVLENTDTSAVPAQVPTIQLKNILSPGVFLSIGIPKCPLSVNLGVQAGPNLRKISLNENGQTVDVKFDENKLYLRYSISICVDIPIVNFYTKSLKL